jgi:hypothetical protein
MGYLQNNKSVKRSLGGLNGDTALMPMLACIFGVTGNERGFFLGELCLFYLMPCVSFIEFLVAESLHVELCVAVETEYCYHAIYSH